MGNILGFASRQVPAATAQIGWEMRYDGILAVAMIDGVAIAGISGPWPDGQYALTWWASRDVDTSPTLEFHATMELARRRVEEVTALYARAA